METYLFFDKLDILFFTFCHPLFAFIYFQTSDIGLTQNSGDSGLCFEIWFRKRKSEETYTLKATNRELKDTWTKDLERILWEQAVHNRGTYKEIVVSKSHRHNFSLGIKKILNVTHSVPFGKFPVIWQDDKTEASG